MKIYTQSNLFTLSSSVFLILATAFITSLEAGMADQFPDTRGPVQIAGAKVLVSPQGVQSPGYVWKPFATDPDHWQGQWIHASSNPLQNGQPHPDEWILRKTFTLAQPPTSVHAKIAANGGSYQLFVNGIPVSRGPADQGGDFSGGSQKIPFYDLRDLTPFVHQGNNTVVFLCHGSVAFEAEVSMPDGKKQILISDGSWKGAPASFLHTFAIPVEDQMKKTNCPAFDGALEAIGWNGSDFNDSAWINCSSTIIQKGTLQPSELPPCMEAYYPVKEVLANYGDIHPEPFSLIQGKSLLVTNNGGIDITFDRVMSGRCGFKIKGGAGARVYYQTGENKGGKLTPQGVLLLRNGIQTYETERFSAIGSIHLDFRNVTSPIEVQEVTADWTSQPVAYEGSFSCSDDFLNKLWQVSRTSVQINLQTHHLDSPTHQEPISDYGDYLIEDLVAYNAFGTTNPWLMRQDLRKWAYVMKVKDYHTFHTSYTLLWLQSLVNYYQYTGDKALLEELAPFVHELLATFTGYIGKTGIVSESPNYMFMDWVSFQGLAAHHPPANIGMGYMTAFFCRALSDGILISKILGDKTHAETYEQLRKNIASAYNSQLWDGGKGLYKDGVSHLTTIQPNKWMPPDTGVDNYSHQNNSLAVAYQIASAEEQPKIMEKILAETPWNLQPYFMHFVFDAMEAAGVYDKHATEWLRKWTISEQTQSLMEANGMGDLSHGWTSTPLYQLSARVLGVRPASPGFKTILIKPYPCDLTWAKGTVPTPFGKVTVSWTLGEGKFTMDVTIPEGTEAIVEPPIRRFADPHYLVDGKKASPPIQLAPGSHHLELTGVIRK